ncbi:hypothetical protein [Asticcacaulis sp.]
MPSGDEQFYRRGLQRQSAEGGFYKNLDDVSDENIAAVDVN